MDISGSGVYLWILMLLLPFLLLIFGLLMMFYLLFKGLSKNNQPPKVRKKANSLK